MRINTMLRACSALLFLSWSLFAAECPAAMLPVVGPEEVQALVARIRKPVVLVFWASWCGPCSDFRETRLIPLAQKHGGEVAMVGISVDADPDEADRYVRGHEIPYLAVQASPELRAMMHGNSIPTTMIFDAEGRQVKTLVGDVPYLMVEHYVRRALAGDAAQ